MAIYVSLGDGGTPTSQACSLLKGSAATGGRHKWSAIDSSQALLLGPVTGSGSDSSQATESL